MPCIPPSPPQFFTINFEDRPSHISMNCSGFISPESFMDFFLNKYIPPQLRKSFKFMVLRLLANTFVSQIIESAHFQSCSQKSPTRFYHPARTLRQKEITLPEQCFLKIYFSPAERGKEKIIELIKITKGNLGRPTRVLVRSFDKFHHFVNFKFLVSTFL